MVKIDVKGAEALVLKGAKNTLKRTKFVVVETEDPESHDNSLINYLLTKSGFIFAEKRDSNGIFASRYNVPSFGHSLQK